MKLESPACPCRQFIPHQHVQRDFTFLSCFVLGSPPVWDAGRLDCFGSSDSGLEESLGCGMSRPHPTKGGVVSASLARLSDCLGPPIPTLAYIQYVAHQLVPNLGGPSLVAARAVGCHPQHRWTLFEVANREPHSNHR